MCSERRNLVPARIPPSIPLSIAIALAVSISGTGAPLRCADRNSCVGKSQRSGALIGAHRSDSDKKRKRAFETRSERVALPFAHARPAPAVHRIPSFNASESGRSFASAGPAAGSHDAGSGPFDPLRISAARRKISVDQERKWNSGRILWSLETGKPQTRRAALSLPGPFRPPDGRVRQSPSSRRLPLLKHTTAESSRPPPTTSRSLCNSVLTAFNGTSPLLWHQTLHLREKRR